MTPRTKQALQAAIAIIVADALFQVGLLFVMAPIVPLTALLGLALSSVWLFPVALVIWWFVFRTGETGIWHAVYAGLLIGILWHVSGLFLVLLPVMVTGRITADMLGEIWSSELLLRLLLTAAMSSIKFIFLASIVRWWQLRRADAKAAE